MSFDLIKLKIKVNLLKLRSYYSSVENNYQHLRWTIDSPTAADQGVGGHRVDKMFGWAIHTNAVDLDKPYPPYNIGLEKSNEYRWTALDFDIIEDFKKAFPFAHGFGIAAHPPGTFINSHVDSDDWIKIHVPIFTSSDSYFYFGDNYYSMDADGSLYLVNTTIPHGTDNKGNGTRIHLLFKIPAGKIDYVKSMDGLIG